MRDGHVTCSLRAGWRLCGVLDLGLACELFSLGCMEAVWYLRCLNISRGTENTLDCMGFCYLLQTFSLRHCSGFDLRRGTSSGRKQLLKCPGGVVISGPRNLVCFLAWVWGLCWRLLFWKHPVGSLASLMALCL